MLVDEWFDDAMVDDHGPIVLHGQHTPDQEGTLGVREGRGGEGVRGEGGEIGMFV